MDYIYLRAWNNMMGSMPYWNTASLEKARHDKAPEDAIYNTNGTGKGGEWRTFREIERQDTKDYIEKYVREHTVNQ